MKIRIAIIVAAAISNSVLAQDELPIAPIGTAQEIENIVTSARDLTRQARQEDDQVNTAVDAIATMFTETSDDSGSDMSESDALAPTNENSTTELVQESTPLAESVPVLVNTESYNRVQYENEADSEPQYEPEPDNSLLMIQDSALVMTPGVNEIIPISLGHPNRIVTPFQNPSVTSASFGASASGECSEVCIRENVIYVVTDKEYPITMFITEAGSEAQALSLTMFPRRIPPREVFLRLDPKFESQNLTFVRRSNLQAKAWEESQPYVETIRTLFRSLAHEQIPQGYTLNRVDNQLELPFCEQNGLAFQFRNGQILQGHHFNVFVGVARNVSSKPVEFMGAGCGAWNVAAVTSWPHTYLEPGQATEVYVAVRQGASVAPTSTRPSLIGGGL